MKFIHLTDTHLVCPGNEIYGLDPQARLNAAINSINEFHSDAEMCMITGDLTHNAEPEAYLLLMSFLEQIKVPTYLLIGNHDDRKVLKQYLPHQQQDENGFIQYTISTPEGLFIALDTVLEGTHQGAYCEKRLQWLQQQLQENSHQNIFLFAHHPPFKTGLPTLDVISIQEKDAVALNTLLARHSNIRHLFFGHIHRPLSGYWGNISFSSLRSTCHQVALDFAKGDSIPGSHEQPAYCVVLLEHDQLVIHTHDYLDSSPKFSLGSWDWSAWKEELPA